MYQPISTICVYRELLFMLISQNRINAAKIRIKNSKLNHILSSQINIHYLICMVALYLVVTANFGFFEQVLSIYPLSSNLGFIFSITALLFGVMWLLFQLLCYRVSAKPVLITMLLIGAICNYFTDTYGTIFDRNMLINSLQTDQAEAMGLMSLSFLIRVVFLGIVPAVIVAKISIKKASLSQALWQRAAAFLLAVGLIIICLLPFGDQYATFFRHHKIVRSYVNPITPVYSAIKLTTDYIDELRRPNTLTPHAIDAKRQALGVHAKPKLMVFVVGETVRADHVGLNGYERETMPRLAKNPDVYSFNNATSCGTATAYSVPCMFSYANRDDFDIDSAEDHENVIDTLNKQGVKVVWRDNNSSSKGVADRVTFENYKTAALNPSCDVECRDIGMLHDFDKLVTLNADHKVSQDTLIMLHQMGNHGPAYFQRYPKSFEKFKPVCMTNELSKCTPQSVINGYDNAIYYTDYFLDSVIKTLENYEKRYDVTMIYVSDHGESLGENNIYLHGLPYAIAPRAQKHIPVIIWSPNSNGIDNRQLSQMTRHPVSHDFITPTLLEFFGISTNEVKGAPTFFKMQNLS